MLAADTAVPDFFGCSRKSIRRARTFTPNIKPSSSLLKRGPPESPWCAMQPWVISFWSEDISKTRQFRCAVIM
jgi:hypothetical protein